MVLARAWALCPGALRADFLSEYGVRLEGEMARGLPHAADLAAMLPADSRTWRALDPDAPPPREALLWALELDVRALTWALGGGKGARPEPLHVRQGAGVDWAALEADLRAARQALGMDEGEAV